MTINLLGFLAQCYVIIYGHVYEWTLIWMAAERLCQDSANRWFSVTRIVCQNVQPSTPRQFFFFFMIARNLSQLLQRDLHCDGMTQVPTQSSCFL